jgi:rhodanese-related sulfurtransferase
MNISKELIATVAISAIVGGLAAFGIAKIMPEPKKTNDELIEEFYRVENAVHVSPHSIRGQMDKGGGNYILVDVRSPQEYERAHIISAINIPAYTDPNTPAYQEVDRIVSSFKKLIAEKPNKDIIVYCYSTPCMTGKKVGKMLIEHDIYVKHLGIGWNEWRYSWGLWNHEHELDSRKVEDYIWMGKDPGTPTAHELPSPCGEGELGC